MQESGKQTLIFKYSFF